MPITGRGWELHVERLGLHASGAKTRTYGAYQAYLNGQPIAGLSGHMCESIGPGDNSKPNNGRRIEAGRYPLWTQFGRYRSIGYSTNSTVPGDEPMPGILLGATNKRTGILIHPGHPPTLFLSSIGCLNPTNPLAPSELMNFWDSRERVIALLDNLRAYSAPSFSHQVMTAIPDAWVVIDGEPMNTLAAPATFAATSAATTPDILPISKGAAIEAARWLTTNFGAQLKATVAGKGYGVKHLCGIVCQETAYKWLKWIDAESPATMLARCVFDASGDYPNTSRSAFPVNTAAFRARYGDVFTDMLIAEANATRRMQGWEDKPWVYKGYGIFQYDLQKILSDRAFFENRQWYDFDACLVRCTGELDANLARFNGDLWKSIKAYNGSGAAATQYAENVKVFTEYCASVTGEYGPA